MVRHNHYSWHAVVTPPTHNSETAALLDSISNTTLEGSSSKNNLPTTYTGDEHLYVAPETRSCTNDKNKRFYKNIDLCEQEWAIHATT